MNRNSFGDGIRNVKERVRHVKSSRLKYKLCIDEVSFVGNDVN